MNGIYIILFLTGLLGMLPLAIILYKRRRVQKILATGLTAKARVYQIHRTPRLGDTVLYTFYNEHRQQYYGSLHCKPGLYELNEVIDIYYLQNSPKRNTLHGAWKSPVIIGFGIAIAVFIWFAVYKLFEMVNNGSL